MVVCQYNKILRINRREQLEREYIRKIKEIAEKGKTIYSNQGGLQQQLKKRIRELKEALMKCVDAHAEEFGLIISNDSSSEIALYELVDRVKSSESLKEKIIRNNVFIELTGKKGDDLRAAIRDNIDDLMGLRFLVSLSCDCEKLFDLLDTYKEELKGKGITLLNLDENPQTMQNGRPIYRIKGKYKGKYKRKVEECPFELQIKSKLDSAWADIEHMLFYKDYQFSYIQSTNKQVMKKLGDLLDQVDELMMQVRESQASYKKDRKEMEFTQYLGTRFREQIKEIVGSAFVLNDYRGVLFDIFSKHFNDSEQERILQNKHKNIVYEFHRLNVDDKKFIFVKNYMKLIGKSLEFTVSEHIYVDWLNNLDQLEPSYSAENLAKYFKCLIAGLCKEKMEYYLKNNYINEAYIAWGVDAILDALKNREMQICSSLFLNDSEKMYMLYSFHQSDIDANDKILDSYGSLEEYDKSEIKASIIKINYEVIAFLFEADVREFEKIVEKFAQNISDIMEECEDLNEYYSREFIGRMDKEYNKVKKTVAGKAMPVNVLSKLFDKVMGLRRED